MADATGVWHRSCYHAVHLLTRGAGNERLVQRLQHALETRGQVSSYYSGDT